MTDLASEKDKAPGKLLGKVIEQNRKKNNT